MPLRSPGLHAEMKTRQAAGGFSFPGIGKRLILIIRNGKKIQQAVGQDLYLAGTDAAQGYVGLEFVPGIVCWHF